MKSKLIVIGIAAVALLAAGCNQTTDTTADTTPTITPTVAPTPTPMMKKTSQVTLAAENGSKQSGTVTFTSTTDNKTEVVIAITPGPAGVAQPAHIHAGACPGVGAVKFPLNSVVDGKSTTIIDTPFMDIWNQLPLAVNVHKSSAEVQTYVSCGALPSA